MPYIAADIKAELNWQPFRVGRRPDRIRSLKSPEGIGDRLRAVAFAELQARDGFLWGIARFPEAPAAWREAWSRFAAMENRHAQLLLDRAAALNIDLGARVVTDNLLRMFHSATDAEIFLYQISTAEERGMDVGSSMVEPMQSVDPETAEIFRICVAEEEEHVATARQFLAGRDLEHLRQQTITLNKAAVHEARS